MTLSFMWGEIAAILQFMGSAFLHLAPFLAISVPLAVALKRSGASEAIRTRLGKNPILAVTLATFIGAVSPLCSCGVIPVIAAMLTSGVPLAPVMSFWLASPSMDPEILFLSAGSIGWPLAIWRLVATFGMSFGAGLIVIVLERKKIFGTDYLKDSIAGSKKDAGRQATFMPVEASGEAKSGRVATAACGCGSRAASFACCRIPEPADCGCGPSMIMRTGTATMSADDCDCEASRKLGQIADIFREAGRTAVSLALWMLLAFFLEALISRYFPTAIVAGLLGKDVPWAIPLATAIGIPLYTTNLTALGVVNGLMAQGMSGGAALAFLIGGAVTTIPAMSAVWGIVKRRVFLAYLGFAVAGSLLAGYAYQLVSAFA